jgi:hypothetical protein
MSLYFGNIQQFDSRITKLFTTPLLDDKEHADESSTVFSVVRNSATGNINSTCYYWVTLEGTFYIIGRAFVRFDFSGIESNILTAVKLVMPKDSGLTPILTYNCYVYELANDSTLIPADYSGASTLYGNSVINGDNIEVDLNASGIAAVQAAMDTEGLLTLICKHEDDVNNIAPTTSQEDHKFIYENIKLEFTY